MNKDELIKFIDSIDFEYCSNLVLTYYKKKPKEITYYDENDSLEFERKTITFQKDLENLINEKYEWNDRKIEHLIELVRKLEDDVCILKGSDK